MLGLEIKSFLQACPLAAIIIDRCSVARSTVRIVAWGSWVPNLLVVEWYIHRSRPRQGPAATLLKA